MVTSKPVLAIVGRPNVGKSTLFNRLIGKRVAIVEDKPGTTRDRVYADISWKGHDLFLVDTGGLEPKPESSLRQKVKEQVEIALNEANILLFLVDAREGVMPVDLEIADILRRSGKPVVLVANKVDSTKQQDEVFQFYELGMGEPIPVSAYHGKGADELLDRIGEYLPPPSPAPAQPEIMKIAIVGRANVGKSMLLNAILGEERVIVNESPGTTRDAIDTLFSYNDDRMVIIDSAGIRRRGKVVPGVERYSVMRALQAIERADVALLVTDASEFITEQDTHIGGYIQQAYKGVILIVNKWDLVEVKDTARWTKEIRQRFKFMPYAPILFVSAKTGQGVKNILPIAKRTYEERRKRLPTPLLEALVKEATLSHPPPAKGRERLSIYHATQTEINPPTFVFSVNNAKLVHFSYERYLENKIRQAFKFEGTPLRLVFKSRGRITNVG